MFGPGGAEGGELALAHGAFGAVEQGAAERGGGLARVAQLRRGAGGVRGADEVALEGRDGAVGEREVPQELRERLAAERGLGAEGAKCDSAEGGALAGLEALEARAPAVGVEGDAGEPGVALAEGLDLALADGGVGGEERAGEDAGGGGRVAQRGEGGGRDGLQRGRGGGRRGSPGAGGAAQDGTDEPAAAKDALLLVGDALVLVAPAGEEARGEAGGGGAEVAGEPGLEAADAGHEGRVGGEEHLRGRGGEEHVRDLGGAGGGEAAAARGGADRLERGGHSGGVARELDRGGVGEELALAGDHRLEDAPEEHAELADEPEQRAQQDHQQDRPAVVAPVAGAIARVRRGA